LAEGAGQPLNWGQLAAKMAPLMTIDNEGDEAAQEQEGSRFEFPRAGVRCGSRDGGSAWRFVPKSGQGAGE
jgi:hypothetical protein